MTRTLLLTLALLLLAAPGTSHAHVATTGYSEIRQDGSTVHYRLGLEYDLLATSANLGVDALSGTAAERAAILREQRAAVTDYLLPRLTVSVDGAACDGSVSRTGLEQRQGTDFAVVAIDYRCPAGDAHAVRYDVLSPIEGVVDSHTNIADYEFDEASGRFIFDDGNPELKAGREGFLASASHFVVMGVEHILLGWDHVIFLLVLLLGARTLREVAQLATTFTAAHSVTLVLASLGWVEVPAEIVEPLIALSIAYVAVQTALGGTSRYRLTVVFGFGLLHGLGFAGSVSFGGDAAGRLLESLLSFNVGIEVGQALIVATLFPLLLLIRRYGWSAAAQAGAASAAAAIGVFWFAERLPL